jgi:hypothetical protein
MYKKLSNTILIVIIPPSAHSTMLVNGGLAIFISARLILATMKNGNKKNINNQTNGMIITILRQFS